MVIVQNPTLAPAIEKSDYEPKTPETDASVDADTVNDATAFLETFFKLYPTAIELITEDSPTQRVGTGAIKKGFEKGVQILNNRVGFAFDLLAQFRNFV